MQSDDSHANMIFQFEDISDQKIQAYQKITKDHKVRLKFEYYFVY